MKEWKVENRFAWLPVFIRNNTQGIFANQEWVWFKKYTRVWKFSHALGRYRTYDTVKGHTTYFAVDPNELPN